MTGREIVYKGGKRARGDWREVQKYKEGEWGQRGEEEGKKMEREDEG